MACTLMKNDSWRMGQSQKENIGQFKRNINYFNCGTYYFDGELYVVEFPVGLQLYHGSPLLMEHNNEFPVGKDFYSKNPVNLDKLSQFLNQVPDASVQEAIGNVKQIDASWYGDHHTSKIYSQQNPRYATLCQQDCVLTYRLKRKAIFIVLDNDYNIYKLTSMSNLSQDDKQRLLFMYSIKTEPVWNRNNYYQLEFPFKERKSFRDVDLIFTQSLCQFIANKNYAGYAANVFVKDLQSIFHLEFVFCNPLRYLDRDHENPIDWQYTDYGKTVPIVKNFLKWMKTYKTTNVNWHSGDLYQHSVWTLFFCEDLFKVYSIYTSTMSNSFLRKIAVAAFLHDIGKMDINDLEMKCRPDGDCFYFSLPSHPQTGADFIQQNKPMAANVNGTIQQVNMTKLLEAFGIQSSDIDWLACIIKLHYDLGMALKNWRISGNMKFVSEYIQLISSTASSMGVEPNFNNLFAIIVVSIADIRASEAFTTPSLGRYGTQNKLNVYSQYLPFISNMPRQYHGGNLINDLSTTNTLAQFGTLVLEQAFNRQR